MSEDRAVYERTTSVCLQEPKTLGICCRVTIALQIIVGLELIFLSLWMIGCFRAIIYFHFYSLIGALIALIAMLCVVRLLAAAKKPYPNATLPYIIWKCTHIALMISGLAYLGFLLNAPETGRLFAEVLTGIMLFVGIYLVLSILFLAIVIQARSYLVMVAEKFDTDYFVARASALDLAYKETAV